ncbi:hypothetical protein Syun_019374 [Stephania yunnanensis]|uniref:Importin N-terminal domain-containing protein n=1 Tax=Stephania yunnanensis TaxID=152371 RepID=A0AAP0IW09_9MAGN
MVPSEITVSLLDFLRVHGRASVAGAFAIQLAKFRGAKVFATADMTKKRLVDYVLTNTYKDLQSFDSDETQPPSEDQRNENETQDEVLEGVIKYRWNALPPEQRDGLKNYILEVIVQLSSNEASFRRECLYVNKLNVILVQAWGNQLSIASSISFTSRRPTFVYLNPPLENRAALLMGMEYLIDISYVEDTEVFKAKLQRRRQELTQTTPDQPMDGKAVYYKVAGDCPKGCVYSLRSLWRKKRRYVDSDASISQVLAQRGMDNFMILRTPTCRLHSHPLAPAPACAAYHRLTNRRSTPHTRRLLPDSASAARMLLCKPLLENWGILLDQTHVLPREIESCYSLLRFLPESDYVYYIDAFIRLYISQTSTLMIKSSSNFHRDHSPCDGFEEVSNRYNVFAQLLRSHASGVRQACRHKVHALMHKLKKNRVQPVYVTDEAWRRYLQYWESEDFQARSRQATENRNTEVEGPGTGPRSTVHVETPDVVPRASSMSLRSNYERSWSSCIKHLGMNMDEIGLAQQQPPPPPPPPPPHDQQQPPQIDPVDPPQQGDNVGRET